MSGLRLLPWSDSDGKPCYLATDDGNSPLSRRADEIEALQVSMGKELLDHARALLGDRKAGVGELQFLADRLCEALRDVLRVAESRGGRLSAPGDGAADPDDGPHGPDPQRAGELS
ncbi:hypothetical protein [Streptomyces sp. ME19-01-6]|uniref:hypothetical protein n=1 Tax=Streptomyces sp. ME19-01-6 TaxID=3028686 RepID=UPI0029A6687F|nr:hypothetical protein [Streptomyces sp. ME19-01-6]MDX3226758.1 hypothetical protein [Streptomyces sp. ME19-01-6]